MNTKPISRKYFIYQSFSSFVIPSRIASSQNPSVVRLMDVFFFRTAQSNIHMFICGNMNVYKIHFRLIHWTSIVRFPYLLIKPFATHALVRTDRKHTIYLYYFIYWHQSETRDHFYFIERVEWWSWWRPRRASLAQRLVEFMQTQWWLMNGIYANVTIVNRYALSTIRWK